MSASSKDAASQSLGHAVVGDPEEAPTAGGLGTVLLVAVNVFFTGWVTAPLGGRLTVSRLSRRRW